MAAGALSIGTAFAVESKNSCIRGVCKHSAHLCSDSASRKECMDNFGRGSLEVRYGGAMRAHDRQESARAANFARARLLNEELDRLNVDASERAGSVTNKASFLAVAAGVIIAASTAQVWTALGVVGIAALALACVGLICAAIALRPGKRIGIQARRLVDRNLDTTRTAAQIEAGLVEDKAAVLAAREDDIAARATWIWYGFVALIFSTVSLTIVYSAEVLGG
jgi:hypothetical protein